MDNYFVTRIIGGVFCEEGNMIVRSMLAFGCVFVLANCHHNGLNTARVDYSYAKPSRTGMLDPRATPAGTFYLWNVSANRLTPLGQVALTPGTASAPRDIEARNMAGFGVSGLPINDVKIVEASIGGHIRTTVSNSVRQGYYNSKSALSKFVLQQKTELGSTEADILDLFRPKDPNYRVVIFIAEERSGKVEVYAGGTSEDTGGIAKFEVKLGDNEIVTVSADAYSKAGCSSSEGSEARPVCFTEAIVYDPYIQENGKMGWRIDDGFSQSELSEALRSL
uniref:hypothetical protein n=1 Tax=Phaeobacter sp. PT47_59 TaxID=3029979 RepID=UPI00237FDAE5|nr:hypothetical protein [Phaeobacter sp. PT47_59]